MSEPMSERDFNELLIRRTNRDGTAERLCSVAHAEIARLRAEVERLVKSRNRWGQKYNKLLGKNKNTRTELATQVQWVKDLADSLIAEEAKTSTLRAEVERLRAALEWYGDKSNYYCRSYPNDDYNYPALVFYDLGERARRALGDTHE